MNLREIEDALDRLENELRACRRHGVEEFTRQAARCRERAAELEVEAAIWHEAARRIDHGSERARELLEC